MNQTIIETAREAIKAVSLSGKISGTNEDHSVGVDSHGRRDVYLLLHLQRAGRWTEERYRQRMPDRLALFEMYWHFWNRRESLTPRIRKANSTI